MQALIDGYKYCSKCDSAKLIEEFSYDVTSPDGRTYWCKECAAANARKSYAARLAADPVGVRRAKRNDYIKHKHGISLADYEQMIEGQDCACAICGGELKLSGTGTHLDHDHETGALRAMLCTNCNRGLGHFQDSIELLVKASKYLGHYK